ncbi:MAG: AP2 domain-containing protein [Nanoarchaeota archaeon]
MVKYIKLSGKLGKNLRVIVDGRDFDEVNKYKWHFDGRYAARKPNTGKIYLHRFIMGNGKGEIDHINQNKLDCRKLNLRFVSRNKNLLNVGLRKTNTSGHKGVTWHTKGKKWVAQISVNYKNVYLGLFNNIYEAVKARQHAEGIYYQI